MPPKRKNDESGELGARERKKLKLADARTIAIQPTPSGSGSGTANEQSNSATTGPSKTTVRFDATQGLPASIDVERFTEARAYEIDAMQKAIKTAGESSTHRAWQTLPRHLRRRAASHDVRRVPVRLREKARAEMDTPKRKVLGRPKRGKANQIGRTEALLKRQRDKTWLETHIWHAKRAKMECMWGYRLAATPTEKAFRPSHRASVHGSILHDASYYATIELKGPQDLLHAALETCCDPLASGMKRCMTGGRACETHVYKHDSYPFDLLGPITIICQPVSSESESSPASDPPVPHAKGKGKGKEKKPQTDNHSSGTKNRTRVIWVRTHPAVFEDVFEALKTSASYALHKSKEKDPKAHAEIEIADLRGSVNAFEIMGPMSSQVIKGALSPVGSEDRGDFKKFWGSLTDLQTPGNVPRGMVIGFKVLDPRLKFPPKNAKPRYPDPTQSLNSPPPAFIFPTALTAQSEIWDEEKRGGLRKPKYKKKDIDERRAKNLVPGTPLDPLRQDDRIPVILIQRSLEPCPPSSMSSSISANTQGIHGWTLLFPAGWSMPFLSSLIFTGTRFAGQRERTKQFFEAGVPAFPKDYPSIHAYNTFAKEHSEKERARWERTPPAKRANYEKLGTRSAWSADWDVVLGLEKPLAKAVGEWGDGLVTTQRQNPPDPHAMEVDQPGAALRPWLLRGPKVPTILSNAFITPAQFLGEITKLRAKNHMSPLGVSLRADDLMKSALVMVRAKMVRKGAPTDLANIYKMDDVEARKWVKAFSKPDPAECPDSNEPNEQALGEIKPVQADIIGYVTSGDVSLSRGEGFAIGAIPVMPYLALRKQAQRLAQPSVLVKIRDRHATLCRVAYLELLDA
ncbi:hypothetical protein PAXRUDRAFT_829342 [Paxillus rubicundulus Ve08.2h10]|uniref:Uncharacterized protein n=1 Tax=Paxillus rubicundulus Ve08.2h10 TaxID=930991 RepID=A0A0D0E638_9AGAM|nr:hypothetical protein PAXRUDRAFT_829342 [Paxillus rubicundulus Ve08.2h10]